MDFFPPTIILRHRKENLKKCSLQRLEKKENFLFYSYPWKIPQPDLSHYIVLCLEGPILNSKETNRGIFLIDGTWNLADKMLSSLKGPVEKRTLPRVRTAYPRRQEYEQGLASIEALYLSYLILGRNLDGILENYIWKEQFLSHLRADLPSFFEKN